VDPSVLGAWDAPAPPIPLPRDGNAGLSSCLEEGRLLSDGGMLGLSVFDVDALRIAEQALARRAPVLVCPPDPFAPLSALVAAAAHVTAMIGAYRESGRAGGSPLRIAVVSGDYRLRGFYRGLAVAWRRGVGGVPMRSIVPAATMVAGGRLSVVDSDTGSWSTAFVKSIAEAEALGPVDLIVVDLPVPDAARLGGAGVPLVVIARDPLDPAAGALADRFPSFGYDTFLRDWRQEPHGSLSLLRLANRQDGRVTITAVPAPAVCDNAGLFWDDVPALVRLGARSPYVAALTREAFSLFHDLLGLAMPPAAYARLAARPLAGRVADLAHAARLVASTELRQDWLPMVEAELAGILAAVGGSPGKAAALLSAVAAALDDRRDVLVVARTAVLARAYSEYLQSCHLGAARVTSLGALADARPADLAVLPGMAPSWARWVYRSGAAAEMAVLAYAPLPVADGGTGRGPAGQAADPGFSEAAMIATAIGRQDAAAARLSGPSQRARAWAGLRTGNPGGLHDDVPRDSAPAAPGRVTITMPPPPEAPPGLWTGSDWIIPLEPGPAGDGDSRAAGSRGRIGDTAPGFLVTFADGSWAWLAAHGQVWRWRRHSGIPRQAEARDLAVGDDVVLIDGDAHKTLLAKLLDAAENIPALALASGWHGHWRAALERAREGAGSYAALTRRLGALGCRVQAETVRLWCTGATIGPDDPADLGRVGEAAGDPVLAAQAAEVWRAMRTLRGAHVRAGRRLAALARVIGPAAGDGRLPADEVIDPASGLTAGDLGAAVMVLHVTRIEPAEAVPLVLAGARRPACEPADFLTTGSRTEGMAS
jgi:hypothetical protein